MSIPKVKIRIQIEITCSDCDGAGELQYEGQAQTCSGCDGTGYQTDYISIDELKEILDSGE